MVLILGALTLNVWVGAMLYHPVEQHMVKQWCADDFDGAAVTVAVDEPMDCASFASDDDDDGHDDDDDDYSAATVAVADRSASELPVMGDDGSMTHETVSLLAHNLNGCVIINELNATSIKVPEDRYLLAGGGTVVSAALCGGGRSRSSSPKMAFSSCSLLRGGDVMHHQHQHQHHVAAGKACGSSLSSLRYVSTPFHGSTLVSLYEESRPAASSVGGGGVQQRHAHSLLQLTGAASRKQLPSPGSKATATGGWRRRTAGPLQLLRDPLFIVILVSNATTAIGYTNSAILLPSYAISVGHDKSSSQYLLSVVAVLDLVGRIGGSTLSDWIRLDKRYYYLGGLVLSGVALFVLPFADDYPTMCWACAAFGLGSGVVVGITAVIMVDMLGEERLSSSYGISLFCNGLMQLIGPPVAGYIFETIGSYRPVFHGMGVILLFGASVWLLTPFLKKNDHRTVD